MTDAARAKRNDKHIANLPYVFRRKVRAIIKSLEGWGWRPVIVCSLRSYEEQAELVRKGYSRTMNSKHLRQSDGYAHAVDMVCDGIWWDEKMPGFVPYAKLQGHSAESFGCRWGGRFKGYHPILHDWAHIEYKTA